MRSPEPGRPRTGARIPWGGAGALAAPLFAACLFLGPALAGPAFAQAGPGAQRYEVTISPPRRPGTEEPAPTAPGIASPEAAASDPASVAAQPAPAQHGEAADTPAASAPRNAAPAGGPMKTLQVGAYRQKGSAEGLRDSLAASFRDVAMIEVESGGEPLYRVNVGRLPKGPALEELKRRLLAAGHPAFEVPAPGPETER